ncbi:MAG: LytTR family DNA-binding domain-containing protein [Solobacterium sp.]|jgi:DNA-binding LytR/AlgR family response regulator|nr:LytTR family DNA-binding domain-containing protein [Solobacterium sp.]MCH4205467.1 LytTR family DNA-binding domain-containing protein [Solobacterium sp.]MCH4226991.1 LytTR family DNA-binding domain-containing protein [Solobacterium sp.]MCH4282154.1 LytTR family DNA-binding domain-containing protein [Solobacterium sp.]
MKLKIAICDDSPEELKKILDQTEAYAQKHTLDVHITSYSHPDALLLASDQMAFDLYLLDIIMPMMSGIEVGRHLREQDQAAQIIYVTSSSDYAVNAFAIGAAHYLIKPFSNAAFEEAMDRSIKNIKQNERIEFSIRGEDGGIRILDVRDIEYIESIDHIQVIHTSHAVYTEQRRSISKLAEELEAIMPEQFIVPYRGFIVNLKEIAALDQKNILMHSGKKIPIPHGSYHRIQEQYMSYRFRKKDT